MRTRLILTSGAATLQGLLEGLLSRVDGAWRTVSFSHCPGTP